MAIPASLAAAATDAKPAADPNAPSAAAEHKVHMWSKRSTIRTRTKEPVMAMAFSSDDTLLAVGYFCGTLCIFDVHSLAKIHELSMLQRKTEDRDKLPVTAMTFRPTNLPGAKTASGASAAASDEAGGADKPATTATTGDDPTSPTATQGLGALRPVLLCACSDGQWHQFDASTAECLRSGKEEDNEIYTLSYNCSATHFATAGRDAFVRVYEEKSGAAIKKFSVHAPGSTIAPLRIYSTAWHMTDPHVVFAGGWSQVVTAFDIRARDGYVEPGRRRDVFGPVMMGDAMALVARKPHPGDEDPDATFITAEDRAQHASPFDIFTVSHRMDNRLELYDASSMTKTCDLPWPSPSQQFLPLCAAASGDGHFLAFGGGGGHGFVDGCMVIQAPSSAKREKAAHEAIHLKMVEQHPGGAQAASGAGSGAEGAHIKSDEEATAHAAELAKARDALMIKTHGLPIPVAELRQPGRPIVAVRFSHHAGLVAFGDTEGLLHVFEAPRRRH